MPALQKPPKPLSDAETTLLLTKTRTLLLIDHPFFGQLCCRLPHGITKSIPTAATNGKSIIYNSDFVARLTQSELLAVEAHEVGHNIFFHFSRQGERELWLWNIAGDLAINSILKDAGFTLPKVALFPDSRETFKFLKRMGVTLTLTETGRSAEEYYSHLEVEDRNTKGDLDVGGCGSVLPGPSREESKQMETEWKIAVAQAAAVAKAQGRLPGNLEQLVDKIVNPQVPWTMVLRDFLERTAKNDYNPSIPNRRYLNRGIVLPSLISEELPEIVIGWDTSGSTWSPKIQRTFASEMSGALSAYDTTVHILYGDADVASTQTLCSKTDLPIKPAELKIRGGGGTDFRPVFQWVEKQGMRPSCLIYLTDGDGAYPDKAPEYPVIWVMNTDNVGPFGQTVRINA